MLSAFKSPYLRPIIGENEYETAWDNCMAILERYHKYLRSAANARQALPAMRGKLSQSIKTQGKSFSYACIMTVHTDTSVSQKPRANVLSRGRTIKMRLVGSQFRGQ